MTKVLISFFYNYMFILIITLPTYVNSNIVVVSRQNILYIYVIFNLKLQLITPRYIIPKNGFVKIK